MDEAYGAAAEQGLRADQVRGLEVRHAAAGAWGNIRQVAARVGHIGRWTNEGRNGRSEACASGRVVEGTAEYDERLEDINQYHLDVRMSESDVSQESHEKVNSHCPTRGADSRTGHRDSATA